MPGFLEGKWAVVGKPTPLGGGDLLDQDGVAAAPRVRVGAASAVVAAGAGAAGLV